MLIPPKYTPVQITVPDDRLCRTILNIWEDIYQYNQDKHSYISHLSLVRTYNLIYTLIKTDKLNPLRYPYTEVPLISAENINFYKLNYTYDLILKEENNTLELINYAGTQEWYKNGKRHRDNDLPAIIHHNGTQEWYKNGKLHRDNNLAAIIYPDGSQLWYQNGVRYANPS